MRFIGRVTVDSAIITTAFMAAVDIGAVVITAGNRGRRARIRFELGSG